MPLSLWALDPAKSVFQFNCQNWTRQNGLSAGKVSTVAQTSDGYIWLGTSEGLERFDGINFEVIPADFPGARGREVRAIVPSRTGGLLLTINNGGFASYFEGKFSLIADSHWPNERMTGKTILEARNGAVWTGSNIGAGRWVKGNPGEGWFTETFPQRVFALCEDPAGRIWVGSDDGLFSVADGKRAEIDKVSSESGGFLALVSDPVGNIWAGMGRELRCYSAEGKRIETPPLSTGINTLLVDSHGTLWIGTSLMGLARYQNGEFTFLRAVDGLGSDYVTSLCEDAEGSLWVGTSNGVSHLTDLKFPLLTNKEGIVPGPVHTVSASRQGGLWITTSTGVSYFDGKTARNYTKGPILSDDNVKLGFEAKNGDVYLANQLKGIDVLSGDKLAARYACENWVEAIGEDAESIVVGLGTTLWRARDGKLQPYAFAGDQKPNFGWFDYLEVARDGTIWIPSYRGIFRIKDGHFKQWPIGSEGSTDRMHYLFEDVDGSIWAGLSTGIARIKNDRLQKISAKDGLYDELVYAIVPDDHGYFWIDSGRGIFRVTRRSLNDFADGKSPGIQCEAFGGLESVKFTDHIDQEYSGCKTLDGRIWFPNAWGVVTIDPANYFTNNVPPPVDIQQIRVNGVELEHRDSPVFRVGDRNVEFHFAALSYIASRKVQVQYQLEGFDPNWVDAGARRSVLYNSLAPGRYRFRIKARNADGVWNSADADFAFTLPPAFHETGWFYTLCGLAGVLMLVGAYRWKVRRMEDQQKYLRSQNDLLEVRVGERTGELAYERDLLRTLMDNSPDDIYFKDAQSRFLKSSKAQAASFGVNSPEEMIGRTALDFYTEEHARQAFDDEQEIVRTGRPLIGKIEQEIWRDGRKPTWKITSKLPLHNKANEIIGTFGISKDITAIKDSEAQLLEVHKQLMESSRQAGMAEVATGVLHNVGNVLNSVNVSATLVMDQVRHTKAVNVARLSTLFDQHRANLADFLANDPRGQMVPSYLGTLAESLTTEHAEMLAELDHLRRNVEHIKDIVAMQQTYARTSGVTETLSVPDMVEDALRINSRSLARHDIDIVRDYQGRPVVTTDKHKVMQILINLVRNAKHACDESGRTDNRIVVRITADESAVRIAVTDNGVGIPVENLTRIFAHGFTTRAHGHGFGLHSSALAAKDLEGSLTAQSDGPGTGATFVLELPFALGMKPQTSKA